MVAYEPMSLRSSSSSSTRLITTRSTNKSLLSASASLSPPPPPTTSTSSSSSSSSSPLSTSSSSSITTSIIASTSNTASPSMVITQMDSDTSSTSSLKRRRGRPLKSSQSADPSSSSSLSRHHHNKKQHISHNNHGHDLQNTTYKLDRLRLKQATSKDNLMSAPAPMTANMIRMGIQVDAWKQDQGDYYRARIVELEDGKVFVHFEGFPPDQADWIHISDLRALDDTKHRKHRRQQHSIYPSHSNTTSISETASSSSPSSISRKASLQQIDEPPQQQQYYKDEDEDDDSDYHHHLQGGTIGGGKYGPKGQESNMSWQDYSTFYYTQDGAKARHHTGLVQDRRMGLHCCPCHSKEFVHPERPDRLSSILQQLHNDRILRYVKHMPGREATSSELSKAHTAQHIRNYTPEEDKVIKVTSIAALLNPIVSPPSSPTYPNTTTTTTPEDDDTTPTATTKTLRGIGGGVVTETKQGHLLRHRQRLLATKTDNMDLGDDHTSLPSSSSAVTTTTAHQKPKDTKSTYPPDLICQMTCGELGIAVDTTFHPAYSSVSAKVAAGALISLVDAIVQGQLNNGFALIRPPGHHAEDNAAMGFCFFNNVAVAALATLDKYPTQIKKILIIDWDVHHGNGTQKIFYDNPNVLYISIHRWDQGQFYPYTGAPDECGLGEGLGKNVNIALSDDENQSRPMGDPEFVAAFYHLIVPIARQFAPDMIFVSAGFDAAEGHPDNLGGYAVTPRGFSIMTKIVMDLAEELCQGRLVLTLEGGYALQPLAISATASVTQLLPSWAALSTDYLHDYRHTLNTVKPNQGCVDSLAKCVQVQQAYWQLPDYLVSPTCRFQLPIHWRATEGILTRPKREKRPIKIPIVEGY